MTRVTQLIHDAGKYLLISVYPLPTHPTHNCTHKNGGNLETLPGWPKKLQHNKQYTMYVSFNNLVSLSFVPMNWVVIDLGNGLPYVSCQGFTWTNTYSLSMTLTHWGREKMAAIFQTTFSNAFSWMKIYEFRLNFHRSLVLRVQLTTFQHWFR